MKKASFALHIFTVSKYKQAVTKKSSFSVHVDVLIQIIIESRRWFPERQIT